MNHRHHTSNHQGLRSYVAEFYTQSSRAPPTLGKIGVYGGSTAAETGNCDYRFIAVNAYDSPPPVLVTRLSCNYPSSPPLAGARCPTHSTDAKGHGLPESCWLTSQNSNSPPTPPIVDSNPIGAHLTQLTENTAPRPVRVISPPPRGDQSTHQIAGTIYMGARVHL